MKILVMGKGLVGRKIAANVPEADLSGFRVTGQTLHTLVTYLSQMRPDVLVNCIGKTGTPNIDWCEDHKEETLYANTTVPLLLAQACQELKIKLVHMSTGCIYEGGMFNEDAPPNFIKSYYCKTKYLAEQALLDFDVLQLRLRMPIDSVPSPRNTVTKLFSYKKVINTLNSVTILDDVPFVLQCLLERNASGIYHVVNPNPVFHKQIIEAFEPYIGEFQGEYVEPHELKTKAPRSNCTLGTYKLRKVKIFIRPTEIRLPEVAKLYGEYLNGGVK